MTLLELAQKLRPYIEKAAISLSDEDALEAINLFPHWKTGTCQMLLTCPACSGAALHWRMFLP